jgi:hypothetical protein
MRRRLAVGAIVAMVIGVPASVGLGRGASHAGVREGHLAGEVLLCRIGDTACSAVRANVALLRVKGQVGHAVARDYARNGHFSFVVPPGEYVPTAKVAGQPVSVKCLTSRITVRSGQYARVDVLCHHRLRG